MRERLKRLAFVIACLFVVPSWVSYSLRAKIVGADRALLGSSQFLALFPGIVGQYLRRAFYRWTLASFDASATIEFGTLFSRAGATVGANVYVGPMCHIGLAHIENDVLLGAGVHVPSGPRVHGIGDPARPIREQPGDLQLIRIGAGSWVGSSAVVLADVGRDTIIASGAVVTKPVPDRVVAAGVPARVTRRRDDGMSQDR